VTGLGIERDSIDAGSEELLSWKYSNQPSSALNGGATMSDGNAEAAAEGEDPVQQSTPSEPPSSLAAGVKEKTNAEAASGDSGRVTADAEGENPVPQPTPSVPDPSPATGEIQEKINAEAASGDDAERGNPAKQSTFFKPNHPPVPGRVKKNDNAEAAAARTKTVPLPTPSELERPLASRRARKVRKFFHRLFSLVHIVVELALVVATGWLAYATYHLFLATLELGKVTSGLAAVTSEEIQTNKSHATSLGKRAQEINLNLASIGKKFENLDRIFPGAHPSKLTIGEDDFSCRVSKGDGKWILHDAADCDFLKINSKSQLRIGFNRDGRSWECLPAHPDDNGRKMTTDLKPCFEKYNQERRGDIEFMVKVEQ
jgi:hypothetical protein